MSEISGIGTSGLLVGRLVRPREARSRPVHRRETLTLRASDTAAVTLAALAATGASPALRITFPLAALLVMIVDHGDHAGIQLCVSQARIFRWVVGASIATAPIAWATADLDGIVRLGTLSVVLFAASRLAVGQLLRSQRRRSSGVPALIVGSGPATDHLVDAFLAAPEYGVHPVPAPVSIERPAADLRQLLDARPDANRVIVSADMSGHSDVLSVVRDAVQHGREVLVQPRFSPVITGGGANVEMVGDVPLQRITPFPLTQPGWRVKRAFDISIAILLLVPTLPVIVISALLIWITSPGPVLFRQTRLGAGGKPFTMLKLRTFPVDHQDTVQSLATDECPLWVGRLLRRTSIDELPQLWNVLRGDMSVVGPRPERPAFAGPLAGAIPGYEDRHRVPGGITGLAQVNGYWGPTCLERRIRFDNRYIDTWTLWSDVLVLARTVPAVIRKALSS